MVIHSQTTGKEIPSAVVRLRPGEPAETLDATVMQAGTNLSLKLFQIVGIPPLLPLCGIRVGTSAKEGAR